MSDQQSNPASEQQKNNDNPRIETKQRQMRRIGERGEMPAQKSQLIEHLSLRIKQAEEALADTEDLLESEVKEREALTKSLEERNAQLNKLYEVDQKALPDKIKEKLNEILSETVAQKIEAEEKLADQRAHNYEFTKRSEESKAENRSNCNKLEEQVKSEEKLSDEISNLEMINQRDEQELQNLEAQCQQIKQQKQSVEDHYLQMKVAMERMNDIRVVLNRFFGSEDLWDQKMDLKHQIVERLPLPTKAPLPQNRQKTKQGNSRLKPIVKTVKNDDEDFWRAEFRPKY